MEKIRFGETLIMDRAPQLANQTLRTVGGWLNMSKLSNGHDDDLDPRDAGPNQQSTSRGNDCEALDRQTGIFFSTSKENT